jgi:ribosomal protein S7
VDSFLESLNFIKPVFNSHYVILRGQKKEFPTLLPKDKQFRLTIRWVKNLVQARREHNLSHRIYLELLSVKDPKRHLLLKRRDELFSSAVINRFNLRYSY